MQIPPGLSGTVDSSNIFTRATDHDLDNVNPVFSVMRCYAKSPLIQIPARKRVRKNLDIRIIPGKHHLRS